MSEKQSPQPVKIQSTQWKSWSRKKPTSGFNDQTLLDAMGHFHSDPLRVTERFHRRDFGYMDFEMTFDDTKVFTKPFTLKVPHDLLADADIFESYCGQNEKDRAHLHKQ